MRKMAAFVFSLLIMLACAVQARGETTADDAREAARRTATVWYLAATYGKSSSQRGNGAAVCLDGTDVF